MRLPVPVRRAIYRCGYRSLQLVWLVLPTRLNGVKCLITDGEKVLLVRHSYGRRWWDLPGGTVGLREAPQATAAREMAEELGLTIGSWEPIGSIEVRSGHRRDTLHCFRAEVSRPALRIDAGELLEARWFARGELPVDLAVYVIPILARTTVSHGR